MDVIKVKKFSQQHQALKMFLEKCKESDVELTAKRLIAAYGEETLDSDTTRLIIGQVRAALLDEIMELEKLIKKEAAK